MADLQHRLLEVQNRISLACQGAQRSAEEIELIVVTKNHPADLVLDLLNLGVRNFGENRNQEAEPKALEVRQKCDPNSEPYRWHFVGQLQSNKVKNVINYAEVLHSLDRSSLLAALEKELEKQQKSMDVFIELNLTANPDRGGIQPDHLLRFAESVLSVPALNLLGVMGVASLDQIAERDFETIYGASQALQSLSPQAKYISAGMSDDFEIALRHGATHLRIGTAITGKRQY